MLDMTRDQENHSLAINELVKIISRKMARELAHKPKSTKKSRR